MKILFLVYHGFSEASGISKKIHYQVDGLRQNGHEVHLCYYDFDEKEHRCRYVDTTVIKDYGKGMFAALRQRVDYKAIYDYCTDKGVEVVYARSFQNASPPLIRLFKKLNDKGVKCVTEIPTYPYDSEFVGFNLITRLKLRIDQLFRKQLSKQMKAIVTFSDAEEIFGQRTIRISNGVNFDAIPLLDYHSHDTTLNLIGVAEVHYWHGFDRLIAGIGEYYRNNPGGRNVVFHIVGGVGKSEMHDSIHAPGFAELIEKYGIAEHVKFHGQLFGAKLDEVFNACNFAIGSLARHRSGITTIKTLKNREYATRGIPFIYSECDSDFDFQSYVMKAPADESPIDIQSIIDFTDHFNMTPNDIRKTVEHLSWKRQMQTVIDNLHTC